MCGIVGILNLKNNTPLDETRAPYFKTMISCLRHRGPDYSAIKTVGKNLILGHARLSIIDLSPAGHQPMSDIKNNVTVVFNGEIYNFLELKKELQDKGYKFRTRTDTEVIIYSYLEYGIDCIKKFNGMFAIAIYDSISQELYLIRDRIGVKPLYYTFHEGRLIFASEIKSILSYPDFPREPNLTGISSYLSYRYPLEEHTLFKNIHSLLPAHYLKVKLAPASSQKYTIQHKKYWELPTIKKFLNKPEKHYTQKVKELLYNSVKKRMISDVPLGAYLSGGLDSSIIVALMSKVNPDNKVSTFTVGFEEKDFNEFFYANLVAQKYNTKHHQILLKSTDYIENMINLIKYKDAPLSVTNEPALYALSKELKKHITVVLSGEGSDELFGGYGKIFRSPYDYLRLCQLYSLDRNSRHQLSKIPLYKLLTNNLQLKYENTHFNSHVEHFIYMYEYISYEDKKRFLNQDFLRSLNNDEDLRRIYDKYFALVKHLPLYDQYMWIFQKLHIVGLLHRVDTTTMAASVECRVPFVDDHELLEFVIPLPYELKIKWKSEIHQILASFLNCEQISEKYDTPKYLLKQAFAEDLPHEVITRHKMGFPVPVHKWFGKKFNTFARDILLSRQAKERSVYNTTNINKYLNNRKFFDSHSSGLKIWMLLNLELWYRQYIDKR